MVPPACYREPNLLYPSVGYSGRPAPSSTRQWKLLYNKRGSVERAFGRLKEYRKLDNLKIRGLAKVELHAILAVMVMQAQALGSL